MLQNLGVYKSQGSNLIDIYIGNNKINISKIGKNFYALYNDRIIMAAKSDKALINNTIPVVSQIIKTVDKNKKIKWKISDKKYTDLINKSIKNIEQNLSPANIFVLEIKPDEIQDNKPVEATYNIKNYQADLKDLKENIENICNSSKILLNTKLDKTICGSKDVMGIFNSLKTNINNISCYCEPIESSLEHSEILLSKISSLEEKKLPYNKEYINKTIENFSLIKSFISELSLILYNLFIIDDIFKIKIGYPATWFFMTDTYLDFMFEYENLINNLIKCTIIESSVIEPLLIRKLTEQKIVVDY